MPPTQASRRSHVGARGGRGLPTPASGSRRRRGSRALRGEIGDLQQNPRSTSASASPRACAGSDASFLAALEATAAAAAGAATPKGGFGSRSRWA